MKIRLDKYLADMGCGTRSEVKKAIRSGNVTVNSIIEKHPEQKINTGIDCVEFNGCKITYSTCEYYMLNKPSGVISAVSDSRDMTVIDLIRDMHRNDLFPVGRLDKDTEGLLLITNDGDLAHRLLSPSKHVNKTYFAKIRGKVTEEDINLFRQGVEIGDDKPALPAELEICSSGEISEIRLTIQEGRFHQVKRMFHSVGKEVIYLKRLQMGTLVLDENLKPGEYRKLTEEEVKKLCLVEKKP